MSDAAQPTRPAHPTADLFHSRLMLAVFVLAIAGCCWLISAGQGSEEGHLPWKPGSPLHFVTTLMAMEFRYPTRQGVEVKWLVQGLAASIAVCIAAAAWCARLKERRESLEALPPELTETASEAPASETSGAEVAPFSRGPQVREDLRSAAKQENIIAWYPGAIAAMAFLLLAAWSVLSALWSPWPAAAFGEGIRYTICVLWAVALAACFKRAQVRQAATALVVILTLTAILGIWYYHERNPNQRLKFPIGNPIFLASCLLPGIALALAGAWHALARIMERTPTNTESPLSRRSPWLILAACVAALIVMSTALRLTGSRGPQLGLIVGVVSAFLAMLHGRSRQRALIVLLVLLIVGVVYLQVSGFPTFITHRMDTVMLRAYAWSYALRLFAEHPLVGQGQAGYVLLSQHLSMPDAQFNPIIFPGEMMGHAHNEWIEVLCDLGIVGFVLVVAGLVATFWSGVRALRRAEQPGDQFLALGLLAAFAAVTVAEATDVGLRMPGLPIIFYSIMGCLWALDSGERPVNPAGGKLSGPPGRAAIWTVAVVLSGSLLVASVRDWHGALAERSVWTAVERRQWPQALQHADYAAAHRLSVEAALAGEYAYTSAAYTAAAHRLQQMREMLARRQDDAKPDANILNMAGEDAAFITQYVQACLDRGSTWLLRMPDYPGTASRMGEALLVMQDMQTLIARLGLVKDVHDYTAAARELIGREYQRDPLDPEVALRLLQLSRQEPIKQRLSLLLPPLRAGPVTLRSPADAADWTHEPMAINLFGEFELVLGSLLDEPGFDEAVGQLVDEAQAALNGMDAERCLREYVPERLRLAARVHKLKREFAAAVHIAQIAANVARIIRANFPDAESNALVDLAGYTLLAKPEEPFEAVEVAWHAIQRDHGPYASRRAARLQRYMAYLQLTADDEDGARDMLSRSLIGDTAGLIDALIERGLIEVCQHALDAWPAAQRPAWFEERMQRVVQLMPDAPETLLLQATVDFERGHNLDATAYLDRLAKTANNPALMNQTLAYLARKFPNNAPLQEFIHRFQAAATQPVGDTVEPPRAE